MPNGVNYRALTYKNIPLTIEKQNDVVLNIGYCIFTPEQRLQIGNACGRFVERFALCADLPLKRDISIEQEMQEERIFFNVGSFNILKNIAIKDTMCVIEHSFVDSRYHRIRWTKKNTLLCDFAFIANPELLLGSQMIENENNLSEKLKSAIIIPPTMKFNINDSDFIHRQKDDCYILSEDTYISPKLKSSRYFKKNSDGSYSPLLSSNNLKECFTNLMTSVDHNFEYIIRISLQKYNYSKEEIEVPLSQWVSFCLSQNCIPYCGIVSMSDGVINGLIIMRNDEMGYNHVMRVKFDIKTIQNKGGVINARLNAYVPTFNIKNIYYEQNNK